MSFTTRRLGTADLAAMRASLRLYAEVFGDLASYQSKAPGDAYLLGLLDDPTFLAGGGGLGDERGAAAGAKSCVVGALAPTDGAQPHGRRVRLMGEKANS